MDIDYSAASQLSPAHTIELVIVVIVVLGGALVNAVLWTRRHAQRARAAAESVSRRDPRSPGHAVVCGRVETEDPNRPAVTVTIRERGQEHVEKNKVSHTWKEFDRRVVVEPFYLVLESGTRLRVEPDPDVFLADGLEIVQRGNPRTRRAALENGELAYIDGVLEKRWQPRANAGEVREGEGLYRDALPTGLVMTNGVERMLISTEPLGLRHERRSRAHRTMALVFAAALLLANTAMFGSVLLLSFFGDVVEARVLATRTWVTTNKNSHTTHYGVHASYTDPATGREIEIEDEVGPDAHALARAQRPIPFRVVHRAPSIFNVGTGATVGPWHLVLSFAMLPLLLFAYVRKVRGARDWFDRDILEERARGPLEL